MNVDLPICLLLQQMYFRYKSNSNYAKIEKSSVKKLRRSEIKITFYKKAFKKKFCTKKTQVYNNFFELRSRAIKYINRSSVGNITGC